MDQSIWIKDRVVNYFIESQRDCRSLLNILQQANIKSFKLEVAFSEKYQLQQFEGEWSIQNDEENTGMRQKQMKERYFALKPQAYRKEEIMDLGGQLFRGLVFMSVYRQDLEKMQDDYRIKFLTYKQRLHIFMVETDQINIICKNRLLDMNRQLCIFFGHEQDLILMLSSSTQLRKELFEKGVSVWFKSIKGEFRGIFFSLTLDLKKMLSAIQIITQYDIAITNLNHRSLLKTECSAIVSIIKECLGQSIKQIENQYELKIQADQQGGCINMHYQHAIFGEEPSQILQKLLNHLVIFSVKSVFVRELDNRIKKIKKNSKKMPFLAEKIHRGRRQTFLAVNTIQLFENHKKSKEYIEQFLKMFDGIIQKNLQIKLYLNYMTSSEKYAQKIIRIGEDNNLIVSSEPGEMKIVLKLKDFSQGVSLKRFKQLMLFLENMITPQNLKPEQSVAESFIHQDKSFFSSQNHTHSFQQLTDGKYRLGWLKIAFKMPNLRKWQQQECDFMKDRRNREIESLFNKQGSFKFKIWNIELSASLSLPASWQQSGFLLKGAHKGTRLKSGYTLAGLNDFNVNEQGMVAFITKQIKEQFIPIFIFERIE